MASHPETTTWRLHADHAPVEPATVMGILNVTPDSFYDGGRHDTFDGALERAMQLIAEGAEILDIGGESTRPGATPVSAREQVARTAPLIEAILAREDVPVSIDTTSAEVAAEALAAGAVIINDVSAARDDPEMLPLAAACRCGLVLMHRLVAPADDAYSHDYKQSPEYGDVVDAVRTFLVERAEAAVGAGVSSDRIVIDPGFGFGKSVGQNFEMSARIGELIDAGYPVLSAVSRKSFIGHVADAPSPEDRLPGTLAISLAHHRAGIRLFRVHDVAAHVQAFRVQEALETGAA